MEELNKTKENFVLVVVPLTRWRAWIIYVFNNKQAGRGYFGSQEVDRRKWTDKAINDDACMLRIFGVDPNLYQTEVHFFPWSKLKTVFPMLIPAEVLKKYGMKF
jgi:hypothetical protein